MDGRERGRGRVVIGGDFNARTGDEGGSYGKARRTKEAGKGEADPRIWRIIEKMVLNSEWKYRGGRGERVDFHRVKGEYGYRLCDKEKAYKGEGGKAGGGGRGWNRIITRWWFWLRGEGRDEGGSGGKAGQE